MENSRNFRVVVDTNVFISGLIIPQGNPHQVVLLWLKNRFLLLSSQLIREELQTVLSRAKFLRYGFTDKERLATLQLIKKKSVDVSNIDLTPPFLLRDPKDVIILSCALAGKADYLVTGDEDLLAVQGEEALGTLHIVTPQAFLAILNQSEHSTE